MVMSERVTPGPICGDVPIREAVCAHTKKVYDSCRSKECIQDLRVYLTRQSQELLERSNSVKPRRAELLWVDIDVQPVDFNRGFFSVDVPTYTVLNRREHFHLNVICGNIYSLYHHSCKLPFGFHVCHFKTWQIGHRGRNAISLCIGQAGSQGIPLGFQCFQTQR